MTKKVPYKKDYDLVSQVESISHLILLSAIVIAGITIGIEYCGLEKAEVEYYQNHLTTINCFFSVGYFITDIFSNYLFGTAESHRREDFNDNSLNTNFSEENSAEYFTNDNLEPGVLKLGVNCFENSFFTKAVLTKMLKRMVIQSTGIFLLYVALALFTTNHILTIALQLVLPFTYIQQTLRLFILRNRIKAVFKRFQTIFSLANKKSMPQAIIHNVVSYETSLAWASIKTNSDIFEKLNDELSVKWIELKRKYNIG